MRLRSLAALAAIAISTTTANAQPVNVNYDVTGSAGNWLFNFTVSNTGTGAAADLGVYLFGVQIGPTAVQSSPTNWSQYIVWTTSSGSGTTYYNTWKTDAAHAIGVGNSLAGFSASSFALDAPTQVRWFAYAISQSQADAGEWYTGGANFNGQTYNPGFESSSVGTYHPDVIEDEFEPVGDTPVVEAPEPSSYLLVATGIFAIGFMTRRRRQLPS